VRPCAFSLTYATVTATCGSAYFVRPAFKFAEVYKKGTSCYIRPGHVSHRTQSQRIRQDDDVSLTPS
jgi:hypothetical protein